ncbi:MAG: redox-sensing transcriptional repressor Rex [Chitinivibrionales bacterium]|nr:redox-sensing transcriptional repressor Rex [Chitinivibrionales bacterium]
MPRNIPKPAIQRLCRMHHHLRQLEIAGITRTTSPLLAGNLGFAAHSIRKDINFLGEGVGEQKAGYDVSRLRGHIAQALGLESRINLCIVGLGRLGTALMHYADFPPGRYALVAGFDSNVNKLETLATEIPLFAAYEMSDVVHRLDVHLACLTVPHEAAQECAGRLCRGGIRGILNFTSCPIQCDASVKVRNLDVITELDIIAAVVQH